VDPARRLVNDLIANGSISVRSYYRYDAHFSESVVLIRYDILLGTKYYELRTLFVSL